MDMMDQAVAICEGVSQLAQRRQKYNDAYHKATRRCGSCRLWMTRQCPHEHGVMIGGPPSSGTPCDLFSGTELHHQFVAAFQAMSRPQ